MERRERRRKMRETLMCKRYINRLLLAQPKWGPGYNPGMGPDFPVELATFQFTGWCSIR